MPDLPSRPGESSKPLLPIELEPPPKPKPPQTEPTFENLQDPYFDNSNWTNTKSELDLDTYFHPLRPNLAKDFGVQGLRPVIREPEIDDFLLIDDNNKFYTWNPNDGRLFKITKRGTEKMTPSQAADLMMNGIQQTDLMQMAKPKSRTSS
ncbi:hypothetical protein GQ44DRAFT_826999 [Phaeosphaeriaceae sp. PMI808]|nr:hypothetical protein GQ44DRAFT_826999 [Phaeosphaeriaceae sp. PMI808]